MKLPAVAIFKNSTRYWSLKWGMSEIHYSKTAQKRLEKIYSSNMNNKVRKNEKNTKIRNNKFKLEI